MVNNFLFLINPNFKKNYENLYNEIFDVFERLPNIYFKINKNEDNENEDNKNEDNKNEDNKNEDNKNEDNENEDNKNEDNENEDNENEDNKNEDNKNKDNENEDNKNKDNENEDNKNEDNKNKDDKYNKIFDKFFFLIALINMKIKFGNHNPLILFRYATIFNQYKYIYNIYANFIEKKENSDEKNTIQHLLMEKSDFFEIKEFHFVKNKLIEINEKIILSNKDLCLSYIIYYLDKKEIKFIYYLLSSKFNFSHYILKYDNTILDALKDENGNYIEIDLEKFDCNNPSYNTFLDLIIENKISISSFSLDKYCLTNKNKISLKLLIYWKLYLHHEFKIVNETLSDIINFYLDKLKYNWKEPCDFSKLENELDNKIWIYVLAILEEHKTIRINFKNLDFFLMNFYI